MDYLRKLAGVDVHYAFDVLEPFGRGGLKGRIKVTVSKDRPGHVRQHADEAGRVAELRLTSTADERVEIAVEPPSVGSGSTFRPTALMERVSRAVEESPGLTKNAIRSSIVGKSDYKDLALEMLIAERNIEVRRDGQAHRHYSLLAFRENEDE